MQQTPASLAEPPEAPCPLPEGNPLPDGPDPREANAMRRLLSQYQDELYRDAVTGVFNRRYLHEVCAPKAGAGQPLCIVAARVQEYAAIQAQGPAAEDSCLNIAAGILRTAIDPEWPDAALARWADGTFLLAAPVPADALLDAVHRAMESRHMRYAISLSRRASFTMAAAVATPDEAPGWDALCALALDRLAAL